MKPSQNRKDLKLKRRSHAFLRKGQLRTTHASARACEKVSCEMLNRHTRYRPQPYSSVRNGHLRTTHANAHHLGHYHTKCKQIAKRSAQNDGNLRARTTSATTAVPPRNTATQRQRSRRAVDEHTPAGITRTKIRFRSRTPTSVRKGHSSQNDTSKRSASDTSTRVCEKVSVTP